MSLTGAIRNWIPPPDPRSEPEIESDIADEIAFHLDESVKEFEAEGETPEAARALALQRFGNVEKIKSACRWVALKERIMLQRVNTGLMVVVLLFVGVVSVQVFMTQRYNSLAIQTISMQLAEVQRTSAQPEDTEYTEYYELSVLPGHWRQVQADGSPVPDPITFEILAGHDVRNLASTPLCVLSHSCFEPVWERLAPRLYSRVNPNTLRLIFQRGMRIDIGLFREGGSKSLTSGITAAQQGKWTYADDLLALNLVDYAPDPGVPLFFQRIP